MGDGEIGIGIIGCGGFGVFALEQFMRAPGVRLAAVSDARREAASAAAEQFGVPNVVDVDELVNSPEVDLVYIATPPSLHYQQATAALDAGKHVLSEKPLAVTIAQADEMLRKARAGDLMMVANLMQRYNVLAEKVRELVESKVLGEMLHGYFENYAGDEKLGADHWFWDLDKSAGIFIEHGVHFFDLFASWMGPGEVVAAQAIRRPGTQIEEAVHCTARYGESVLVNFYHGFHQPKRLDRQELRLVFERGEVTMFDWVPSKLRIHAAVNEAQAEALCDLFPGARLDVTAEYVGGDRSCRGRHKSLDVCQLIEMSYGEGRVKMDAYCESLRALLADQLAWIRDRSHRRRLTEDNGRDSLVMAVEATRLAHQ